MRKTPWPLVFVATSLLVSAGLVMWPRPVVQDMESAPPALIMGKQEAVGRSPIWRPDTAESTVSPDLGRETIPQGLQVLLMIVDQDGRPVPDVEILCDRVTTSSIGRVAEGISGVNGCFNSPKLSAGKYEVQVLSPTYLALPAFTVDLPVQGGSRQIVELVRGCVVQGRLQGSDGVPRNHGLLVLRKPDDSVFLTQRPDVNGNFRFPAVVAGEWILSWQQSIDAPPITGLQHSFACGQTEDSSFLVTMRTMDSHGLTQGEGLRVVGIQALTSE